MPTISRQPESTPAPAPESPLVSNAKLRQIYTLMLQCRLLSEQARGWVEEGRVAGELQPPAEQEALLAATAVDLRDTDTLCFAQQDWFTAALKGTPLQKIVRFLLSSSVARRKKLKDDARSLHPISSDPDEQLTGAVEAARAHKRKKGTLAIVYTAGEASLTAWQKVLQLAGQRRLPLLIVRRTRLLYEAAQAVLPPGSIGALAQAYGVPHILVDGRDALAVFRVMQEATGRARRSIGATLIECQISDAEPPSEKTHAALDPLSAMEHHLIAKGIFNLEDKQEILEDYRNQIRSAETASVDRLSGVR